jgi:signal transduction histidine kinase
MRVAFRPPLIVLAVALLALILLLATLQYVWLGRISEAERERLGATLNARAVEFAQDFDRELTRAYLLFQSDLPRPDQGASPPFAERYDRWLATSSYPRLIKDFYVAQRNQSDAFTLRHFDALSRTLAAAEWPSTMADWRVRLGDRVERREGESALVIRRLAAPIWETVPALVVPSPVFFTREHGRVPRLEPDFSYTLLAIDLEYVKAELLPSLAERHFRKAGDRNEFQVAVIDRAGSGEAIYRSTPAFSPRSGEKGDASAPLFQIRTQDFSAIAAEVRRFATFNLTTTNAEQNGGGRRSGVAVRAPNQYSFIVQQGTGETGAGREGAASAGRDRAPAPRWQVVVKHPAGSLEAFVGSTRRRNLIVSTSILAVLAASMALLIVSTRRSQELARQQLEFVAAVSHELRTPLAVIRSAGDNLADGVVHDQAGVKQYGGLIRAEGRRLSEMVEQILELAGIHSGQRSFVRGAVAIPILLADVLAASQSLIDNAGIRVETDLPSDLPPVIGDEAGLGRVFQNLIGNAIKYGASGGWIGVRARQIGSQITVTVSDRGLGIAPAEQSRIFEPFYRAPDVITARIQGAGLGLSLVLRTIHAHGGSVTVKSAPGAGSEFVVTLPIAGIEAIENVEASHQNAEPAQSS